MLKKKGIDHVIVDLSDLSAKRDAAMVSATGGHATVPRVFVNASFVGGADDLEEHLLSKRARSAK
jgi:glutaredoxin